MEIEIQSLGLKQIDYRKLKPLQGNLKDLSEENYNRLKNSFTEKGLFVPMFVWETKGEYFLLDGHGRERFFSKEKPVFKDANGKKTFNVPCVVIPAANLDDAKKKLLIISSQYQTITQEGFDEFTQGIAEDWLKNTVHFDTLFSDLGNWTSDFKDIDKTEANLEGITSIIKVLCPQDIEGQTKKILEDAIEESDLKGVRIE